jgi:hypothetical protein
VPFSIIDSELAGDVGGGSISGTLLATSTGALTMKSCGPGAVNTACFNASQFVPTGSETNFGNVGRNSLYGPGYTDVDTTLYKKFPLREGMYLQVGATAGDLFNHPNFQVPNHNVAAPGLGFIESTVGPPTSAYGAFQGSAVSGRVMVLTGKFVF